MDVQVDGQNPARRLPVIVQLTPRLVDALDAAVAHREVMSRSELVRRVLQDWLAALGYMPA